MLRPEAERRFLRVAQQEGYLTLEQAAELVEELEESGLSGLHALRDLAIRRRLISEKVAYTLFQSVSREMREVPDGIARIGGYEIIERIGRGSMGIVYRARQVSLDKEIALKVLPPRLSQDPLFVERFFREARAAARLNHPNIVAALDVGKIDGFHYFAMELVDGSSVKEIVETRGPIEEREALKVAFFVAKALRHAHDGGIIHRDIKPANIMITADGRVKLTDLGLARRVEAADCSLTQHGKSVGTPYYMSPEQAVEDRDVDARCDIYALGCTLFYMLTGRPPYDAPTPSGILAKHVSAPVPDPRADVPELSEPTARLVMHMMAKRPEARPQTPRDVCDVLRAILGGPEAAAAAAAAASTHLSLAAVGEALARAAVVAAQAASPLAAAAPEPGLPSAGAAPAGRPAEPVHSNVSLPELKPVSSASLKRLRRAPSPPAARLRAHGSGTHAAIAIAAAAILLAGGAVVYALATGARASSVESRKPEAAPATPPASDVAARPARDGKKADRPLSRPGAAEVALKAQEALDREAAERAAAERAAKQPEIEAARRAREVEALAQAARAREEESARREASAEALRQAKDQRRLERALDEIAPRVAEGKIAEAIERMRALARECESEAGRGQALLHTIGLGAAAQLRGLALDALAARAGSRVELALRSGARLEGELAAVDRSGGTLALRQRSGGLVTIAIETVADADVAHIVRTARGFHDLAYLLGEGLRLCYSGALEKGRPLVAEANAKSERYANRFLASIDAMAARRGLAPKEAAAPGGAPATAAPASAPGKPGAPEQAPGGETSSRGGAGGRGATPGLGAATELTEAALLRAFEVQPESFAPDGRVRFRYDFLGADALKQLGGDFDVAGGEVRWDPELGVLRLEGTRFVTHRAIFQGDVRIEAEVVYMKAPAQGSQLTLDLIDPQTRGSGIESIFGIAVLEQKKGKVDRSAGPRDPHAAAWRELRSYTPYTLALSVEGSRVATALDGAVRGFMEGVSPGAARRPRLTYERIDAQLRSLTIEGRLDLEWLAREVARRSAARIAR